MSLITDGILIAASLTACFYCLVLNNRLKALRSTKSGIGATITKLTESVGELESSLTATKSASALAAEKLEDLVGEAGALADFLSDLLERAESAKNLLTSSAAPVEPVTDAGEETPSAADTPLELDYDETETEGDSEKKAGTSDPNIELENEADSPAAPEAEEETIPIDLDYDAEETLKTGTG